MNIINIILGIPAALAQVAGAQEIASETENQLTALVSFVIQKIPLWITAFIVIILSFVIARIVKSTVENRLASEGFEEEHKEIQILAARTANAAVLTIGITVGLKIAGIDLTAIIAAAAFGVGFALRDIIMNFIAGVLLLSSRHYTIGDVIKVKGTVGKIIEIQTRATILKAFDGTKIIVPNAELFKNQVTSITSNPFRKIALVNSVNYGEDLKKVSKVVVDAVKSTKGVLLEPKPGLSFFEWGEYSIKFKIKAWVETKSPRIKIQSQLIQNVTQAMKDAGVAIPYPIQTIELSDEEKQTEQLIKKEAEASPEKEETPTWLKQAAESVKSNVNNEESKEVESAAPIAGIKQAEEVQAVEQPQQVESEQSAEQLPAAEQLQPAAQESEVVNLPAAKENNN